MNLIDKIGAVFLMVVIILLTLIVIGIIVDLFLIHDDIFWIKNVIDGLMSD